MSPTVSQVTGWTPQTLRTTADGIESLVATLDGHLDGLIAEQDALAATWHGQAAAAAAARVVREQVLTGAVAGALTTLAQAYRAGSGIVEGARAHLVSVVADARARGFGVGDNGRVEASEMLAWLAVAPDGLRDTARLRIEQEAVELTGAVTEALRQAEVAADEAAARIRSALEEVRWAGRAAAPGTVIDPGDGGFSWEPDVPATVAAATIGVVTDATKTGLVGAATASGDDVARLIGRGLGPFGVALGTVPAIVNDIEGGMDPAKAVVTEGAGAGVGMVLGGVAGSIISHVIAGTVIGSAVPGVGTAAGLVTGAMVGTFATYRTSKNMQLTWDQHLSDIESRGAGE